MPKKYAVNSDAGSPAPLSVPELTVGMEMEMEVRVAAADGDVSNGQIPELAQRGLKVATTYTNEGYQHGETEQKDDKDKVDDDVNGSSEKRRAQDTDDWEDGLSSCFIFTWIRRFKTAAKEYSPVIWRMIKVVLFLGYLAYSGYSLYRTWGTENATRLLLLLVIVVYAFFGRDLFTLLSRVLSGIQVEEETVKKARKIGRWCLYLLVVAGAVVYLALEVTPRRPQNLVSLAGLVFLVLTAILLSTQPERVNWHAVFWGIALQFYLAIFVLRTEVGYELFQWLGDQVERFISYTDIGSQFLFGQAYTMHPFVFKQMPIVIFMNSTIAVMYHFGVIQAFIGTFGRFLAFCLGTTAIESVNAAANIFLGLAEAPLFIRPFLSEVSDSELFAIMTGGFASIAGAVLGIIVAFGIPAHHVLAASVMSAPAALAIAKIMCPGSSRSSVQAQQVYKVDIGASKNLLQALSTAAVGGVGIVVTICANLLVFVAFLDVADSTLLWFGDQAGVSSLSLTRLLSYLFYPLMYLCGVDAEDLLVLGRLVGVKILTNTQLAYKMSGDIILNSRILANYTALTNGTWHYAGDDVILEAWNQTLIGGVMNGRSTVISTYILCGFCNISAVGTCIGTLSAVCPSRTRDIVRHAVMAAVAGNIACFMTGCVAGLLFV